MNTILKKTFLHPYAPMILAAIFVISFVGWKPLKPYVLQGHEISWSDYYSLEITARLSCAGSDYLKRTAAAGPILYRDYSKIEDYLEEQALVSERASLANGKKTSCN